MTFSIWHVLVIVISVAVPVAAVLTTGQPRRLNRLGYGLRVLGLVVLNAVLGAFASFRLEGGGTLPLPEAIVVALGYLVAFFFAVRWTAQRLNDIGSSRWLAVLIAVPLVNLILVIVLLIIGSEKPEAADDADEEREAMRHQLQALRSEVASLRKDSQRE